MIRGGLNEKNVTNVYSMAYTLGIHKLILSLEKFIVEEAKILKAENCCNFLVEAIRVTPFNHS